MGWMFAQADATHLPLADQSVDLVFTSSPYGPQRAYGINAQRGVAAWVDWMLEVVTEMTRVSRGLVLLNCAGWTAYASIDPFPRPVAPARGGFETGKGDLTTKGKQDGKARNEDRGSVAMA